MILGPFDLEREGGDTIEVVVEAREERWDGDRECPPEREVEIREPFMRVGEAWVPVTLTEDEWERLHTRVCDETIFEWEGI